MSHHYRSYSEHQPAAAQGQQLSQSNSIIKIHSDSQQSLDRLFNPVQTAVPLRDRQLPRSFFNPSFKATETSANNNNGTPGTVNQLHCRSMSFDQRPANGRQNFHVRTTSSLAPMPMLSSSSQSSSHQSSSNEFTTSYATDNSASQGTNGWSTSTGNSMEDIITTTSNGAMSSCDQLTHDQHRQHQHNQTHQTQQQAVGSPHLVQSANFGSPAAMQHSRMQTAPLHQVHNHHHHHHHDNAAALHPNHHHHQHHNHNHNHNHTHAHPHNHATVIQHQHQPAAQHQVRSVPFASQIVGNADQHQHQHHQHVHHLHHPVVGHADHCAAAAVAAAPTTPVMPNNHSRSMSFDQSGHALARPISNQNSLHMRTQSTVVAPMACSNHSTAHSSHQSSHEFLNGNNYANQTSHHDTSNGWCSSGYSTDELNGGAVNWIPGQPQQAHAQPVQQAIMQPQTMQHQHHLQMSQQANQAPQQLFYHV